MFCTIDSTKLNGNNNVGHQRYDKYIHICASAVTHENRIIVGKIICQSRENGQQ